MKLTLCMIVKNEEKTLPYCLKAVKDYMDEIVIVDTGSTDLTKEIALRYTTKVYDYKWNNDFSEARNFSIAKATNEFILILDADEIVNDININAISGLIERNPDHIGRLLRINEFSRDNNPYQYQERVNRLFSKKYYHYEGMIHEQLTRTDNNRILTYQIPLSIVHSGYEGDIEAVNRKSQRNIDLLKIALKSNPNDPYLLYQLGKSYYMKKDYELATQYFAEALYYDLDPSLEYVQDMVESYGYALINNGQYENALQLAGVYQEFSNSADFVFLMGLIYMNNTRFDQAIAEFSHATQMKESKMDGVNSYRSYYNLGVIYECLGDYDTAKSYYTRCQGFEPANKQLRALQTSGMGEV